MIFDFIVVGAGTAGSVVAARLSEIANWNVLLIEAGGDPTMSTDVPYYSLNLQKSDIDWAYTTVREKGLFNGLMAHQNRWPRGKVLGGSSTIGSMLYSRGTRRDFDNLAADGNLGWSFSDVLPYFKKSEDMRDVQVLGNPLSGFYHTRDGPLPLSRFSVHDDVQKVIDIIQKAALELGYPANSDVNGVTMSGFTFPSQGTIRSGERVNTAKAYLNPVKGRKNLFVIKHAMVTKILICPVTKRAFGIKYLYKNEKIQRTQKASREIIVCAGVIGSPKLLMLSGVGPKRELSEMGIKVLADLEVGKNLHDHIMFPGMPITINTGNVEQTPLDLLDHAYEYLTRRTGVFASIGISALLGYVNTRYDDQPDILLHFLYGTINDTEMIPEFYKVLGIEENLLIEIFKLNFYNEILVPIPVLLHSKSRGKISLKSCNPEDPPIIEAHYLEDPDDLESIMSGIKFVEKLVKSSPMKKYNATLNYLNYSGCCELSRKSDAYWACALSHIASTYHDQGGTCKMGPATDCAAVVDPLLRVYGIKGLRVADNSILPRPLTGGSLASAILIGEKAADLIKVQWIPGFVPKTPKPLFPQEDINSNARKDEFG